MCARPTAWLLAWSCLATALGAQSTTRISLDSLGQEADNSSSSAVISGNGLIAAFESQATNLVPGDSNGVRDVFVVDLETGAIELGSIGSLGELADSTAVRPTLSHDGRLLAFHSPASTLVPGDTNGFSDVFVRDRALGTLVRVSLASDGSQALGSSSFAALAADGRSIAFLSSAPNLVANDTNGWSDVFVHELASGQTTRVSVGLGGSEPNGFSFWPSISADGRFVAFQSYASNLVASDTNNVADIFVYDRLNASTTRVSVGPAQVEADGVSSHPALSADGRYIAFTSIATNLILGDLNGWDDVFVHDRQLGLTERVSVSLFGAEADSYSAYPSISADGRLVSFASKSDLLVAGDSNAVRDLFVRDRLALDTEQLSVDSQNLGVPDECAGITLSADGTATLFQSDSDSLVPNDTNQRGDIFWRVRGPTLPLFCLGDGSQGNCPCNNFGASGRGCAHSFDARGARIVAAGEPSLDALLFAAHELPPTALCILLQGTQSISAVPFGDGLRCVGGSLARLYTRNAQLGSVSVPGPLDLGVAARSVQLGVPIPTGAVRSYQFYFRDASAAFCPTPLGSTFNTTPAVSIQH